MTSLHNIAFEQSVLTVLMTVANAYETVANDIAAESFHAERHKQMFLAIQELAEQGKPYSAMFVEQHLKEKNTLHVLGGTEYILKILAEAPSDFYNLEFYVSELNRLRMHRDVFQIGERIQEVAQDLTTQDVFAQAEAVFGKNDSTSDRRKTTYSFDEALKESIQVMISKSERSYNSDSCYGVRTGLYYLDQKIGAIEPGHYCVIGGRPGSGKSTLGQMVAITSMVQYQQPVLFISAEMEARMLADRMFSALSKIPYNIIFTGQMSDGVMKAWTENQEKFKDLPIIIQDKQGPTISEVRAYVRAAKRKYPNLGCVVVDYIGLIRDPRQKSRYEEVSEVSRQLKGMAKEFGVAVIALAQVKRGTDKTAPTMSDLKESGQIEQDADQVILVHPLTENDGMPLGLTEMIIAKNRHGSKGKVRVKDRFDFCRFADIEIGENMGGGV